MAEGGEKRSATAHRTPSQIRRHGRTYQATTKQKKRRAKRNAARRKLEREGKVRKGDGKDVHHKRGMSNKRSNLSVTSKAKNRGHGKTRGAKANKGKRSRG